MNESSIKERLSVVETKLEDLIVNHLPHIDTKLNWVLATLAAFLFSTIGGLLFLILK